MATSQTLTLEHLGDYFRALGDQAAGMKLDRPLATTALYLTSQTRENFDRGQSPDGVPWADLIRPSKRRGGKSAKPLRDKGPLMASYVARGSGHVERITDMSLEWGTNLVSKTGFPYPRAHQEGWGHNPAREQIGMTRKMEEAINNIFLEYAGNFLKGMV